MRRGVLVAFGVALSVLACGGEVDVPGVDASVDGGLDGGSALDAGADGGPAPAPDAGDPLAHCRNGARDHGETDRDCGGPCPRCELGQGCGSTADCSAGTCDESVCRRGVWTRVAELPTPRQALAAVYGPDGLIYAIGGIRETAAGVTGLVEAYDPSRDAWTTRAPLPTPRYGLAAVVGSDGRIYAIGGQYDNSASPFVDGRSVVVEAYTPSENRWEAVPSLPNGRYMVAAVAGQDGLVYAIGGFSVNPTERVARPTTYAPGAEAWVDLDLAMTTPRSSHAATVGLDGTIYAVGGASAEDGETRAFEELDPGVGWFTLPPMPTPRKELAAVTGLDGRIYAIGGNSWQTLGVALSRAVEVYDPATRLWVRATRLPVGRFGHAAVTAPDGRIYVIGGQRGDDGIRAEQTRVVEVLVP